MNRRNAMIAYGVGPVMAAELVDRESEFAKAVRYWGPLMCWYSKLARRWTLYQEFVSKRQIIGRAIMRARARNTRL